MNDKELDVLMEDFKSKLPVNEQLKAELRPTFNQRPVRLRRSRRIWAGTVALILCLVIAGNMWFNNSSVPRAEAATLHFSQSFSLLEQLGEENSSGMAEYGGIVYLPLKDRGLYAYDKKGLYPLIAGNIEFVRVSPSGKELVYVEDGSLRLYEIDSKSSRNLLMRASSQERLETPAWSPDGSRILFVQKETGGHEAKSRIIELELKSNSVKEIAVGEYPSYLADQKSILFENENKIISKNLDNGQEKVLDSGRYPAISNDGAYIAYVKTQGEPALEDIWVADSDFKTSKQVTRNSLADAWDPNTGQLIKGKQQPRYTFEEPVWSSDSRQLFAYKVFHTNVVWKKLMQFEVSDKIASPEEVVAGSIQALIYRDEDFAHSFFSYDPGYLKGTSPRQVGYRILNSGQENGKTFVDANTYLSYSDPYYEIQSTRYWLSKGDRGYLIDAMEEINNQVISFSNGEVALTADNDASQFKFALKDLPVEGDWTNGDIYSLVYEETTGDVYFTLNRQKQQQSRMDLLKYESDTKKFAEIASLGETDTTHLMIMDSEQRYVAVEMLINGNEDIVVYDLKRQKKQVLSEVVLGANIESVHTRFWMNGQLIYFSHMEGRDVFLQYDPESTE
ncbi:hypothetical protein D3P07_14100 [Paenibacillus sp. 1011MAR3C5]|uniref:PD40 domain-containing protein n=1 Tax=Paenibacillus sp. 1011MAR3C5 TaxID=1675787 RepID=UPI000E6CC00A|nr:PD40 domain-containing protein [Paenibacillus sp. 1011MAR3C5]RJE87464.1 hypothetical protein D3P07_14100 [Paenibacillus sp. 1011MAR3C5]